MRTTISIELRVWGGQYEVIERWSCNWGINVRRSYLRTGIEDECGKSDFSLWMNLVWVKAAVRNLLSRTEGENVSLLTTFWNIFTPNPPAPHPTTALVWSLKKLLALSSINLLILSGLGVRVISKHYLPCKFIPTWSTSHFSFSPDNFLNDGSDESLTLILHYFLQIIFLKYHNESFSILQRLVLTPVRRKLSSSLSI